MSEAIKLAKQSNTENTDFIGFIGKFTSVKPNEANEIKSKIKELKLIKVKSEHIVKVIDLLPDNNVDLNKIFTDVALDENEAKKILDIIKEYK